MNEEVIREPEGEESVDVEALPPPEGVAQALSEDDEIVREAETEDYVGHEALPPPD